MQAALESGDFSPERAELLRERALEPPEEPTAEQKAVFDSMALLPVGDEASQGPAHWAKVVAKHRGFFEDCAVMTIPESPDMEAEFFLFLYAKQSPVGATFLKLQQMDVELPSLGGMAGADEVLAALGDHFMNRFTYKPLDYITESEVPADPAGHNLMVLQCLQQLGGKVLVSDMPPEPFSAFVAGLPEPPAVARRKSNKKSVGASQSKAAALLAEYPWLADSLH
eukprot:6811548-Lingulodinium_polyedra.AAC.1